MIERHRARPLRRAVQLLPVRERIFMLNQPQSEELAAQPVCEEPQGEEIVVRRGREELHADDIAAQRVREAGGPTDQACYSCGCGCVFAAAVSTTVECPHCGGGQAW